MKKYIPLLLACFALISTSPLLFGQSSSFTLNAKMPQHQLAQILKTSMPAVVNIVSTGQLQVTNDPFLEKELEEQNPDAAKVLQNGSFVHTGSGVIIDAAHGLIVTNAHVIDQAQNIIVNLADGRKYLAQVLGVDMDTDIALLQIRAKNITALPFADSDKLQLGDSVAAIGSPFGLQQTVTSGIISGLHRDNLNIEGFEDFIQTDAPINVGDSGGALVNSQGQLVGINTAILSGDGDGGSIGIGFAIPSNLVNNVIEQLLKYGNVKRGILGVLVQSLNPQLAQALHASVNKGAVVTSITPNSPAAAIGIQPGDIITIVNGKSVTDNNSLRSLIGLLRIGNTVKLTALRQGTHLSLSTKVADPKLISAQAKSSSAFLLGLTLSPSTQTLPDGEEIQGVKIIDITADSLGASMGLEKGDIIVSANNQAITTVEALENIAKQAKEHLLLRVVGPNGAYFVLL